MNKWLKQFRRWASFIILLPCLYLTGWAIAQPLKIFFDNLSSNNVGLIGTLVSFILFLLVIPPWVKLRWGKLKPWEYLGLLNSDKSQYLIIFWRGFCISIFLLLTLLCFLSAGSYVKWIGALSLGKFMNGLFLIFAVGFTEELLFRGWLWGEFNELIGPRWGCLSQALVFSLAHIRLNLDFLSMTSLLFSLFLLGLLLAVRRRLDNGSIWGCIGLHGGLVGGWFVLVNGLVEFSPNTPGWLIGSGDLSQTNPLGGAIAIFLLAGMLWSQLTAVAKAPRP